MTITNIKGVVVEENGAPPVNINSIKGVVSTENSTVLNLGGGGVYTGEWEEITNYASIKVGIYSNQDSAEGGLCFQQSPDQVIIFDEPYNFFADGKKLWTPNPVLKYFRIVYTNGITPTTNFGIQTIYSSVYAKPTSHRLGDAVTDDDDTELIKAVISYRNENDQEYNNVGIQNPFPVDGDSVYAKDNWDAQSDIGDFSGAVTDLFDNLHSIVTNVTATNPKEILVHFNRTIIGNVIGLGAFSGDFSNTEIQIGNSGGIFTTVIDESASAIKYTSRTFQLPITAGFNAVKLLFHTADTVTLSNVVILKTRSVVARLQAAKPDNTVTDINATNGGNLKISLEELESGISVNNNSQLRTTRFGSTGLELLQDLSTGGAVGMSQEHHEIHEGDHFFVCDYDLNKAAAYTTQYVVTTPAGDKHLHSTLMFSASEGATLQVYKGGSAVTGGTTVIPNNNNGNSVKTSIATVIRDPASITDGVIIPNAGFLAGGGKTSGFVTRDNEIILEADETYQFVFISLAVSNDIGWCFEWYEHTNL